MNVKRSDTREHRRRFGALRRHADSIATLQCTRPMLKVSIQPQIIIADEQQVLLHAEARCAARAVRRHTAMIREFQIDAQTEEEACGTACPSRRRHQWMAEIRAEFVIV